MRQTAKMGNNLLVIPEFKTMDHALHGSLAAVLKSGHTVSPRGRETKELLGWVFRLNEPRARKIYSKNRYWNQALAIGELCWHLNGSDDLQFITYYSKVWASFSDDGKHIPGSCYGKRIFKSDRRAPSQWDFIKKTLKRDPQSRRAILSLQPAENVLRTMTQDQPCLTTIQFIIREEKLHCIATMRSNDIIWGLCYDAYFVTMLQELLATELGVSLGWYQHVANSIHIYQPFMKMAHAILAEDFPRNIQPMAPMRTISCLPKFLSAEAMLRDGDAAGLEIVRRLPPYWRDLANPLVAKYLAQRKVVDNTTRQVTNAHHKNNTSIQNNKL
jgi:thymidylate synthase